MDTLILPLYMVIITLLMLLVVCLHKLNRFVCYILISFSSVTFLGSMTYHTFCTTPVVCILLTILLVISLRKIDNPEKQHVIKKRILSKYKTYQEFEEKFEGFSELSEEARKKVRDLIDKDT